MMDIAKVRLWGLARAMAPFYLPLTAMLLAVTFLPDLSLTLPRMVRELWN